MKLRTARILSIILTSIQLFTLLLTVLITLNQYAVKQKYTVDTSVLEIKTIPFSAFCQSVLPLLMYLALIWLLFASAHKNNKLAAGILIFLGVVMNCFMFSVPTYETMLIGHTMGALALASLSALTQAITLTCTPFRVVAFALFCFVIGGYWGLQKEEA